MKRILGPLLAILFVSTSAFAEQAESSVAVDVVLKTTQSWDGTELPAYPKGQPEVTILKIVIPAGVKLPLHQHPVINAGILTKGELTVTTQAGDKLFMKAGDSIAEVVDKWHFGANTGSEPAEILVFYAGVKGQPITVKE